MQICDLKYVFQLITKRYRKYVCTETKKLNLYINFQIEYFLRRLLGSFENIPLTSNLYIKIMDTVRKKKCLHETILKYLIIIWFLSLLKNVSFYYILFFLSFEQYLDFSILNHREKFIHTTFYAQITRFLIQRRCYIISFIKLRK